MQQLPALKVVILFSIGILLAGWVVLPITLLFTVVIVSLLLSIIFDRRSVGQLMLSVSLISGGALSLYASKPPDSFLPCEIHLKGTVTEPPIIRNQRTSFPINNCRTTGEVFPPADLPGKIWVKYDAPLRYLQSGMTVSLTGILHPHRPPRNPGSFNLKAWRERNGYIGELNSTKSGSLQIVDKRKNPVYIVRNHIIETARKYGGDNAPLLIALLTGIRRDVDPALTENLRNTGLSHLLALSGLHIGFLAGILIAIFAIIRLPLRWRYCFVIIGIFLFILLVPPRGSTLRAGIMAAVFFAGPVVRRWTPPINSLALAALVILFFRPGDLFDAGFQLSFAAVSGIILYHSFWRPLKTALQAGKKRATRLITSYLVQPLFISVSATALVIPLTAYHFGIMALGGPVFNIIAIPLLWFIFAGAWLMVGLSALSPGLAGFTAESVNGVVWLFKWITQEFAHIAPAVSGRMAPVTVAIIISTLIWFVISQRYLFLKTVITILLLSTAFIWNFNGRPPNRLQVWFLDVGHGDAQVWRFPDGRTAVIDAGPAPRGHYHGTVTTMLQYYGHERIDLMAASHPEADHIGGMSELIDGFDISLAVASPARNNTLTYARLCSASIANNVHWQLLYDGDEIRELGDDYRLSIIGPPIAGDRWHPNDASLVMLLEIQPNETQKLRLITTGDIEKRGENALVRRGGIEAELLKIPHHGSPTSSSVAFISAIKPQTAVITRPGGYENRYRNTGEVNSRLLSAGITVHHTGKEGAILFEPVFRDGKAEWRSIDWRNPPFFRWFLGLN
ncbi:DNA internalization-related competence protein ComEC/Rec2 [bacterium]|nr:DNA internalization-related competence protein ComEC/Rec2 [bacterium]